VVSLIQVVVYENSPMYFIKVVMGMSDFVKNLTYGILLANSINQPTVLAMTVCLCNLSLAKSIGIYCAVMPYHCSCTHAGH